MICHKVTIHLKFYMFGWIIWRLSATLYVSCLAALYTLLRTKLADDSSSLTYPPLLVTVAAEAAKKSCALCWLHMLAFLM